MRTLHPLLVPAFLAASLALPSPAGATTLRADLIDAKTIKLDGVPKEWGGLVDLTYTLRGHLGKPDIEAQAGLAYDATDVYVAADVTDDVLRGGGGDRVELVLGFPGGTVYAVDLFPGVPGRSAGMARTQDGATISGAKVVEAPHAGGWSLEARVPWSAFPAASQVRVGLRGGLFVYDVDAGSTVKNIIGTASGTTYGLLPPVNTEAEQSLADGLLKEKGIHGAPRFNLIANVAGDAMKERVLVYDRYLVVLGSSFRKGSEYYYGDLGVDGNNLLSCEVRDLTGDGQSEIILRKRFGSGSRYREMMQVMSFGSSETPSTIFQHELTVSSDGGSVQNQVSFLPDGGRVAIKITPGTAQGFNAGNYREPTETSYDPVILPWGTVASQTYKLSGSAFVKASEERQAASAAVAPTPAADVGLPRAPPPPSASELMEKVYETYKRDRGVTGRPRFDLVADVAGDGTVERVLLHDRDIVIFGKGFKGGTGYTFLTLGAFASGSDVLEMTAHDVTGDGKADIIVKGVQHASAPSNLGGGTIDREILMVFSVQGDSLRRVFAAELARSMGRKRVWGTVRFGPGFIELAPGSATEWTERTYPFGQDAGPVGGLEPLLLPWGGATAVRYRWGGGSFSH